MPASLNHINGDTPMGASLVGDGATFRVWAPNASAVHVRGSFNNFDIREEASLIPSNHGYWHGFIVGVKDRDIYKYWITGPAGPGFKRDPYARELLEPNWDCIVRRSDFPWHQTDYRTANFNTFVIYQLHIGAFYTPNFPAKAGTFLDVIEKIPYLADLGVTALQLLPIQEFPSEFSLGYNGTDYFSPEMDYGVNDAALGSYLPRVNAVLKAKGFAPYSATDLRGDMNQLKALVDVCHIYGLAVIFDLVFNHAGGSFGEESLWFFDRQHGPSKWNSLYFSDKDWSGGNVFNFQSDPVRAFLIDNAKFFLDEYRIDGFRFDEVSVIDREGYGRGWDFCQALTGTLRHHRPSALCHAEYWDVNPWIVKETSDANGAGFHSTMTDGPRRAIRAVLEAASYPGNHPLPMTHLAQQLDLNYLRERWRGVNSLENHDLVLRPKDEKDWPNRMERIPRSADPSNPRSWYATSRSRVASGLLLTMPGIPMLFMGQEFLEDKQWSDDLKHHPDLLLFWPGLEGEDPAMRDFLRFTRELIWLRRRLPGLMGEGFALLHAHDQHRVLAFQRWIPGVGADVVVVASFANETKHGYPVGFPSGGYWREVFNSDVYERWVNPAVQGNGGGVDANGPGRDNVAHSAHLTLPANSLLIFSR